MGEGWVQGRGKAKALDNFWLVFVGPGFLVFLQGTRGNAN